MAEGPGLAATIDGRSARRERNRDAVLDAVIDMFTEGSLTPGPAEVAVRSGVSIRSVHRYFEDTDNMICAAMDRSRMRMVPLDRAAAREIAATLDVLLGFDALDHLRRERGFSPAATERTTARAVAAVLAAAALDADTNGESEGVR